MRTAIILGRPHGKKTFEIVSGAETPIAKQIGDFKKLSATGSNEKYEALELWISDAGRAKTVKGILTAKAAKERDEARAKAEAEAKAAAEAAAKKKAADKAGK